MPPPSTLDAAALKQQIAQLEQRLEHARRAREKAEAAAERSQRALRARQAELGIMQEVAHAVSEGRPLDDVLQKGLEAVLAHAGWIATAVWLHDAGGWTPGGIWAGPAADALRATAPASPVAATLVRRLDPATAPDRLRTAHASGGRAYIAVPIEYEGRTEGLIEFLSPASEVPAALVQLAEHVAHHAGHALVRARDRAALVRSEQRYRSISELTSDYAYEVRVTPEGTGRLVWATHAFARITGYSSEAIDQMGGLPRLVVPEDRPLMDRRRTWLLAGEAFEGTFRIRRKDGRQRWLFEKARPLLDEAGALRRVVAAGRDVTLDKEYEAGLVEAKRQAETMARLRGAFLTNMTHEIRTPISAILGFAQVLREEVPEPLTEFAELIEVSGRRLLVTLSDVLDLARVEGGEMDLTPRPMDLAAAAQAAAATFQAAAQAKGLTFELEADATQAVAAPDAVERALTCVLDNAVKFTAAGAIRMTVGVESETSGPCAVVRVSDTGEGIPKDYRPHLFDEFYQGSSGPARRYGGVGLGLPLAKRLVEGMGGTITIEGAPGEGTTVALAFPHAPDA